MGIGTALIQRESARDAVRSQTQATDRAIGAQTEAANRALDMQRPFFEAGYSATAALMDMIGLDRTAMGGSVRAAEARDRGRMVGDTLLPSDVELVDLGKGWYDVRRDGEHIGALRPGGKSGRFINDSGFDVDAAFERSAVTNAEGGPRNPADISSYDRYDWQRDPGYQFRMDEGMRAIERSAASRGSLNSGGNLRAITRYAQGYASEEYGRVFDRIARIAGYGGSAASQGANTIVNTGTNVGNAIMNAGEARASGYIAQGNAYANSANNTARAFGYFFGGGG